MPPKITLRRNSCITNDPCALCGARTDPDGFDFVLDDDRPGRVLVCDDCAATHAPELVRIRNDALDFAAEGRAL